MEIIWRLQESKSAIASLYISVTCPLRLHALLRRLFAPPRPLLTSNRTPSLDKGVDMYTGNKMFNEYEVLAELGRGEHGKVKLARDLKRQKHVAIKIVQRFSRQRRLARLGQPEEKVKKEVAILKKARHPNVVSLLEVI